MLYTDYLFTKCAEIITLFPNQRQVKQIWEKLQLIQFMAILQYIKKKNNHSVCLFCLGN